MRNFLLLLLLSVNSFSLCRAQGVNCGTVITPEYLTLLKKASASKSSINANVDKCLQKTLSIYVHIVLDSNGQANLLVSDIQKTVDALNKAFDPICLSFKICKVDSIVNWKYDLFTRDSPPELEEMLTLYYTDKVINWFFVQTIVDPGGADGFAAMPGGRDFVFLQKAAGKDPKGITAIHEMGHFFGLFHTWEIDNDAITSDNDKENIVRLNCDTLGDMICDTEADPYPLGLVNNACQYSGLKQGNKWYIPPMDNYMSYWPRACICRFTTGQYNRMVDQYLNFRNYLW
jgi:hypothetical protein